MECFVPENFRNCGTVSTKKGVNNSFQWSRAGTAQARAKSYFRRDVPGADKTRDLRATNGAIFWHLYWQFISLVYQKYTLSSLKREPERERKKRKNFFCLSGRDSRLIPRIPFARRVCLFTFVSNCCILKLFNVLKWAKVVLGGAPYTILKPVPMYHSVMLPGVQTGVSYPVSRRIHS